MFDHCICYYYFSDVEKEIHGRCLDFWIDWTTHHWMYRKSLGLTVKYTVYLLYIRTKPPFIKCIELGKRYSSNLIIKGESLSAYVNNSDHLSSQAIHQRAGWSSTVSNHWVLLAKWHSARCICYMRVLIDLYVVDTRSGVSIAWCPSLHSILLLCLPHSSTM